LTCKLKNVENKKNVEENKNVKNAFFKQKIKYVKYVFNIYDPKY